MAETGLRQAVAYLKEFLTFGSVEKYAWVELKEIITDVLKKTGPKQNEINEIMLEGYFRNALDEKNSVMYKNGGTKIRGLSTKQGNHFPLEVKGFLYVNK